MFTSSDKITYGYSDPCICGHPFEDHDVHENGWCIECLFSDGLYGDGLNECEQFKLDNLKFIEDEAKKKNLI